MSVHTVLSTSPVRLPAHSPWPLKRRNHWLVTAGGRGYLKSLSLAKLKKYITAYNINTDRAVEKDDLIDAVIAAKVSGSLATLRDTTKQMK